MTMAEPRSEDLHRSLRIVGPLLVAEGALLAAVVLWTAAMWLPGMRLGLGLAVAVDALALVPLGALLVAVAVTRRGVSMARRPRRSVAAGALTLQIPWLALCLFMAILDSASWIAGAGAGLAVPVAAALWLTGADVLDDQRP